MTLAGAARAAETRERTEMRVNFILLGLSGLVWIGLV